MSGLSMVETEEPIGGNLIILSITDEEENGRT